MKARWTRTKARLEGGGCMMQVNLWMGTLIDFCKEDLFRYKGILSIAGWEDKFIFQVTLVLCALTSAVTPAYLSMNPHPPPPPPPGANLPCVGDFVKGNGQTRTKVLLTGGWGLANCNFSQRQVKVAGAPESMRDCDYGMMRMLGKLGPQAHVYGAFSHHSTYHAAL